MNTKEITEMIANMKLTPIHYALVYPMIFKGVASAMNESLRFQEDISIIAKTSGLSEDDIIKKIRESPYSARDIRFYYGKYHKFP